MEQLFPVMLRTACAYILLLFLARIAGPKMISRITFFDFIIGVTFGSLAAHISLGKEETFWAAVTSALVLTALALLTDYGSLKSRRFRKLEEGEPVVLVSGGQILDENLKKARVSVDKLLMLLRQNGYFDLGDVNCAVLESDGELSVLPKPEKQPATAGDLNTTGKALRPAVDIVVEGRIQEENLQSQNLDRQWVTDQLALQNVRDVSSVFYAAVEPSGAFYVSLRTDRKN